MALTPEQEEYFDSLEDMFAMPGWRILIDDALKQIYQYQADALDLTSWDAINIRRGQVLQLSEFTRLEEITALQKRALLEEDDDADI